MVVSLEFTAFDIEYHHTCRYDHLTVMDGDGTTLMKKSCGRSLPAKIRSRSNIVKLSFGTDGSVTKSGWSVRWSRVASGEDELFEGDMKLTRDQLDALKQAVLDPHGDLGRPRMLEFGPRGPVTDYNAKMEDIRDNMKSILEKAVKRNGTCGDLESKTDALQEAVSQFQLKKEEEVVLQKKKNRKCVIF